MMTLTLPSSGAEEEEIGGLRVAGALRGAAIDRKGTSTRKDDVGFIFSGEIDGARKRKRVKLFFWLSPWSFQVEKKKQEIIIG